ncbi:hypothetical protein [Streptomyces sp. HPF1205]|uniref:hypothetical protein n=1 Tax=Streptomyces sp. HPF1205 TaxID=2873262 RepID=UPI001CEDA1C0|nr:hypothetical protein [Streptomyces sp. HPF1205]
MPNPPSCSSTILRTGLMRRHRAAVAASMQPSSAANDVPAWSAWACVVDLMNDLGMATSTTGNHEFEYGYAELERLQHGGCDPLTGCRFDHPYRGARFRS